jgi:hypothetical protein
MTNNAHAIAISTSNKGSHFMMSNPAFGVGTPGMFSSLSLHPQPQAIYYSTDKKIPADVSKIAKIMSIN